MANYCSFGIRIKGKRGNALLLCHSIPTVDGGSITYAKGTDDTYEVHLHGSCKWSVNFDVTDDWDGSEIDTDLNALPETMLENIGSTLWDYSLRAKSRVLECEVQAHYWSDETGFDHFDHYLNGRRIKKRRIAYDSDNHFDWDSLEFIGHEGEINKDETSEANSLLYASRFVRHFDPNTVLSVLQDQDDDVIETGNDEEDEVIDEDEVIQNLEELLDKLKQMTGELGIEDVSEEDDDDEDDDSVTELLDVKEYWLTPNVQFIVPNDFAIEKSTDADGEVTISIKGRQQNKDDEDSFLLTGIVGVQDISREEQALHGQHWIDRFMQKNDNEEKQYIQLTGNIPALLESVKLPALDLGEIKIRPFMIHLHLRASRTQQLDVAICTIQDKRYDRRCFYLTLLEMLQGFRIDGKTLNCTNLTSEILYNKLEPVYEEDQYTELRFDETKRISSPGWSVCLPVGFCEIQSPAILALLSGTRMFVPEAYAYTDALEDIPVKVGIQSNVSNLDLDVRNSYIDIPSKQGIVRTVAAKYAQKLEEEDGHPYQIVTIDNESAGVFILAASAKNTTIAKCMTITLKHLCQITVIADIAVSEADIFIRSIGHWLSTFEFAHSKWEPEKILLEEPECLEETLQGHFDKFDAAVEQLVIQYMRTASGNLQYLKHLQALPVINIDIVKHNADSLLRSAFETKTLGVNTAKAFVEKLKHRNASEDILKHVYTKLADFEPACEKFQIELANDESNNDKDIMIRAMHDTQIVRVNEPLSIKAAITKWKQEAAGSNPPDPKPGFMSSLEFIRAKQEIEERSTKLKAHIEAHIEENPVITIPGKKFVFSGLGVAKADQKDHAIVKKVIAQGGLFRQSISGVTDYLVVGDDDPGETKIKEAIAQKEAGMPIQIIRLQDLEDALAGRLSTYTADHPEGTEDSEYLEAQNRTWEQIENERQERERLEEERRISKQLAADARAKKNAIEQLVCCLHAICEKKAAEAEAAESDAQDAAKPSIPVTMLPAGSEPQFTIKDGVLLNTLLPEDCTEIIFPEGIVEIEFNAMFPEGVLDGRWFDLAVQLQFKLFPQITRVVLPESLKKLRYSSLGNTFGEVVEIQLPANLECIGTFSFLHWHMRELVIPAATKFIGKDAFTGCTSLKSVTILNPDIEIQPGAFPDEWSEGGCLQQPILRIPHKLKDLAAQYPAVIVEYLDDEIPEEQPVQKPAEPATKPAPTVAKTPYRMAVPEEEVIPAKKKKEGCYIATAVYGSYDAPEVLVLRRFRDETLKRTMLGRGFIRTYYALSPALAQKLRTAARLNALVRKGLDFFVRFLQNK